MLHDKKLPEHGKSCKQNTYTFMQTHSSRKHAPALRSHPNLYLRTSAPAHSHIIVRSFGFEFFVRINKAFQFRNVGIALLLFDFFRGSLYGCFLLFRLRAVLVFLHGHKFNRLVIVDRRRLCRQLLIQTSKPYQIKGPAWQGPIGFISPRFFRFVRSGLGRVNKPI